MRPVESESRSTGSMDESFDGDRTTSTTRERRERLVRLNRHTRSARAAGFATTSADTSRIRSMRTRRAL
jgi:hypothetical protein